MKLYAVVSFWCDEMFGGGELSINSPFYTSREEAEKHMYAREDPDDYIKEYEKKYQEWWKCEIIKYLGKPKMAFLKFAQWHFVPGIKLIAYLHSQMIKKGA